MFDLSPLTTRHLLALAGSFTTVFLLIQLSSAGRPGQSQSRNKYPITRVGRILAIVTVVIAVAFIDGTSQRLSLIVAVALIVLVGRFDEHNNMRWYAQLFWQLIIILIVTVGGWSIAYVTNPFGPGVLHLEEIRIAGLPILAGATTIIWLLTLTNAVNWLDGVDGLAAGVGIVAFLTLAAISLLPATQDQTTLALALTGAGALAAFFIWNFPPARVYLGTSGSWFLGLYIGLIALIGGGKIATTSLVLALPIIDFAYVIYQRLAAGRRPWRGDTVHHFHHRLLAAGLRHRTITAIGVGVSLSFASIAILARTQLKLLSFALAAFILIVISIHLKWLQKISRSSS